MSEQVEEATGDVGMPDAGGEAVMQEGAAQAESAQVEAARELAEHNALAAVFDDVRAQSTQSVLVEPVRWLKIGLVPDHLDAEEFEMLVYEYLEDERAARAEAEVAAAPVYRTATRAVGVPRAFGSAAGAVSEAKAELVEEGAAATGVEGAAEAIASAASEAMAAEAVEPVERAASAESAAPVLPAASDGDEPDVDDNPFAGLELPAGYRLVEMEGEYVLVPDEEAEPTERAIDCTNIVALVGAHSYYLYDSSIMTDTYAHWAFLAAEDDNVVTFADCVREDSRVYPRPLAASSLSNPPFNMTDDMVAQTWDVVRESGAYPDIQQTIASNGDVYYFSTEYLSPTYAASLAEWDAVERKMHL